MDEVNIRSRYTRTQVPYRKRKKVPKESAKGFEKAFKQIVICIFLLLIVGIALNMNKTTSGSVASGIKEALSNNTNLASVYKKIEMFFQGVSGKESTDSMQSASGMEKTGKPLEETLEETNDGSQSLDYGGVLFSDPEEEASSIADEEIQNEQVLEESQQVGDGEVQNTEEVYAIPVNGVVGSPYGKRIHPKTKKEDFHSGVDIEANSGDVIKAVLDGEVAAASEDSSYGKYIRLKHPNGIVTKYGHCSKLLVKSGQKVKKGEVIAWVGSTGNSTGPHLHFEVWKDGKAIDPLKYIKLPVK